LNFIMYLLGSFWRTVGALIALSVILGWLVEAIRAIRGEPKLPEVGMFRTLPDGRTLYTPDLVCEDCKERLISSLAKDCSGALYLKVYECAESKRRRWELEAENQLLKSRCEVRYYRTEMDLHMGDFVRINPEKGTVTLVEPPDADDGR